jgi:two-component system chemotaxis sensor kinase CheA
VSIVVLQAGNRQFGLVVDDILDTEEIVVKPLGKQLKGIAAYAGATIMGDGSVALILDVMGLAQRARIVTDAHESAREEKSTAVSHGAEERQALLLAQNGRSGRVAIPLRIVARLEEFPATVVERSGTQEVMQYRGQIIPLVRLSRILPAGVAAESGSPNQESIQVVAYSEGGRIVGLIVDRILDVIEERMAIETLAPRAGVVGSFVTGGQVTDLLDIPALLRAAAPDLLGAARHEGGTE